jgi:steroid delta-isomerase-like uncharacterized protein
VGAKTSQDRVASVVPVAQIHGRVVVSVEENKALARRALEEVWSRGDLSVVDQIYSPDFTSHQRSHPDEAGDLRGRDNLKSFVAELRSAFPDFWDSVDDQVAEGDKVVTRFTSHGTHQGPLLGVAATGKAVSWMGITIDRIADSKIVENWVSWDMFGVMQAIGATPAGA